MWDSIIVIAVVAVVSVLSTRFLCVTMKGQNKSCACGGACRNSHDVCQTVNGGLQTVSEEK